MNWPKNVKCLTFRVPCVMRLLDFFLLPMIFVQFGLFLNLLCHNETSFGFNSFYVLFVLYI